MNKYIVKKILGVLLIAPAVVVITATLCMSVLNTIVSLPLSIGILVAGLIGLQLLW